MRKMLKNKKKKGFTLIEMVAVVAIIGILAAILVPKVTGYMKEAKKTAVIDQARKVAQAYEAAKMKGTNKLKNGTIFYDQTFLEMALGNDGNSTMKSLIDDEKLDKLGSYSTLKIQDCLAIVAGSDFTINKEGVLDQKSIDLSKSPSDKPTT